MTGADVTELNTDLVKLGYATASALGPRSGWDYFSGETAYALGLLQAHLGLTQTATLPLGQAVFLPGAIQVTGLGTGAVPGGSAAAGATVLTGSSLTPVVTMDLDASHADPGRGGQQGLSHPARRIGHARGDLLGQHRHVFLVLVVLVVVFVV